MYLDARKSSQPGPWRLFAGAVAAAVFSVLSFLAVRYGGPLGLMAILGLALLTVILAIHPFVFFAAYFVALFFADTKVPGLPLSINQILALLFIISWVGHWFRGRTIALRSALFPWLTLMAVYFTVNALLGESPPHGQLMARYVVIYYGLAVLIALCLRSERAILAYAWIILVLTFFAAVAGLFEAIQRGTFSAFAGKITDAVRVKGTASTANVYGWNLIFAFPFAFFLFSQLRSKTLRATALTMGLFILFVALLTLSRQTMVLVVVLLFICARVFRYPSRRQVLVGASIFIALAATFAVPPLVARFLSVTRLSRDYSYLERRDSILICLEVIKARPIWGVGLGSYTAVWRNYLPRDYSTFFAQYIEPTRPRAPDQGYLQITAEGGVVGLVIFLIFVLAVARQVWRIRRLAELRDDTFAYNLAALVLALMVQFLATTFTDDTFLYVRVWLIYPLALLLDERMLWELVPCKETQISAANASTVGDTA